MMLGMVIFWGLVIVGVVWLVRTVPWRVDQCGAGPIENLDDGSPWAKISADDYRERRTILEGKLPPPHSQPIHTCPRTLPQSRRCAGKLLRFMDGGLRGAWSQGTQRKSVPATGAIGPFYGCEPHLWCP